MPVLISPERPDTPDATALINELEEHLASLYPAASRHGFSVQKLIDQQVRFVVLRVDGQPAGCGGVMLAGKEYAELKRMYVRPEFRGRKLGDQLIAHLAEYARGQGISLLRLETGIHQQAAIRMYKRAGFAPIPPFADYPDDPSSLCFEKPLTSPQPEEASSAGGQPPPFP
jgi:putative acetyltransferase